MEYKVSKHAKLTTIILIAVGLISLFVGIAINHDHHGVSGRIWANLLVDGYFFFTMSVAAIFFLALQYVAEMAWGVTTQRIFQAIMAFLPYGAGVLLVVFLASTFHMNHLYHWMAEGVMEEGHESYDAIIAGKSAYLNQPFFWIRTIMYIAVWMYFANWFRKNSLKEDQLNLNGAVSPIYKKAIIKSVLFIAFFAYTSSSAAWDWIMAIDVHWFSTMFGWYCFSGMWVSMMIVAVVLVQYLKKNGYLKEVNSSHIHDLGKWMFAIINSYQK